MAKLRLESVVAFVGLSLAVMLAGPKSSAGKEQVGAQIVVPNCNAIGGFLASCEAMPGQVCRLNVSRCQDDIPGSNTKFCLRKQGPIACGGLPLSCVRTNADHISQICNP